MEESNSKGTVRVLVIDDNEDVRSSLESIFEDEDDIDLVDTAGSVWEGVAKVLQRKPDVVVLDVKMPDGGGIEVAKALAEAKSPSWIIAYSAHDNSLASQLILRAGAALFVSKSAPITDLLDAIRTVQLLPPASSHIH